MEREGTASMGNEKKVKERDQIDPQYKWNIEEMYTDEQKWESDYKEVERRAEAFGTFAGTLSESAEQLLAAMKEKDGIFLELERVYVYARMKRDEDNRVSKYQAMTDRAQTLMAKTAAHMAFVTPELLAMPEERLLGFLDENEELRIYRYVFTDLLREKSHVLSEAEERLMAQFSELTSATNDIFGMINDADIKFGTLADEDGDEVEVTHGNYIGLLQSPDRRVRKEAYEHMYDAYVKQKNTLAATYNYNTKGDTVFARIRKYPSAIEAALSGDNVPLSVYKNLVDTVNSRLPLLHRYVEIRRRALKLDDIHMYDVYVPLVQPPAHAENIPYEKALDMVREGLAPMGEDYLARMNKGLSQRWIDVYETPGKTSGAYSFGTYDSYPYILLNYTGRLQDVFTIIHEMGHSMHSNYTREAQPYVYGSHSIFTAEVASTVNESLLMKHLLSKAADPEEKKYLLNLYIEEFRTTLFRQTMFAEFELLTHQAVEEGEVLTAEWLSKTYGALNRKYFGENVVYDDFISMEWARIPHFYNSFYVYKYATGYSAATALSKKILEEGPAARDQYIKFLKTGDSDDPINLLKIAGVDMSKPEPIELAMDTFEGLIDQLDELI